MSKTGNGCLIKCCVVAALSLVGNSVVVYYFQSTFTYEGLGHSHHLCWVGFSFSAISVLIAVAKLYLSIQARSQLQRGYDSKTDSDRRKGSMMRPLSPRSGGTNNSNNSSNLGYKLTELDMMRPARPYEMPGQI